MRNKHNGRRPRGAGVLDETVRACELGLSVSDVDLTPPFVDEFDDGWFLGVQVERSDRENCDQPYRPPNDDVEDHRMPPGFLRNIGIF